MVNGIPSLTHCEVVFWQLTDSTGFSNIENMLLKFKERMSSQRKNLEFIVIDNCCQWRQKLKPIFGDIPVYLDLFHAISRVTRQIPKRHPYAYVCIRDFADIFRAPGDHIKACRR